MSGERDVLVAMVREANARTTSAWTYFEEAQRRLKWALTAHAHAEAALAAHDEETE